MPRSSFCAQRILRCLSTLVALSWSTVLVGQCPSLWPSVPGLVGVAGSVQDTLVFDPDGPGPSGERVLVSGSFSVAGTVLADNLAIYDPGTRTWSAFGPGPYPADLELAGDPVTDLYVGGDFTSIAGVLADNVAHFDGTIWSPVGGGVDGPVWVVEQLTNGEVVVAGDFVNAGAVATDNIARWDGTNWSSLGSSAIGPAIYFAVAELPNGDLCAGVQQSGAAGLNTVMQFDGVSWSPLGTGLTPAPRDLLVSPAGDVFAAGTYAFGYSPVRRWDGSNWIVLPNAPFAGAVEVEMLASGVLVAIGHQGSDRIVASWDGFAWTSFGTSSGPASLRSLAVLASGEVLAGGLLSYISGTPVAGLARWNGSAWAPASNGITSRIDSLATLPDGRLFASMSGLDGSGPVFQWNGVSWQGTGGGFWRGVFSLSDGEVISCGSSVVSAMPGTVAVRWDGATWTSIATSTGGSVHTVAKMPNGDLVMAGQFQDLDGVPLSNIGRFDGANWQPFGAGLPANLAVKDLVVLANGDVLALIALQSTVMRWDGSTWAQLGVSPGGTGLALRVGADGQPMLAGSFPGADVLRWDGLAWVPLGTGPSGPIASMAVLPNGDVVASPLDVSGAPDRPVERWDGTSWTSIGGVLDRSVWATEASITGEVLLGGEFRIANGAGCSGFARIATACPASVQHLGSGCSNFAHPVLTPGVLPWIGATSRSTIDNLTAAGLVVIVTGLTQVSIPITSIFPPTWPGCQLLAAPDVLQLAIPMAGAVEVAFVVPNAAALIGATFLQQGVGVYLGGNGGIAGALSSNALRYQIGALR